MSRGRVRAIRRVPGHVDRARAGGIDEAIAQVFDLRPAAIIRDLDLLRPIYTPTAAYGHFGRELPDFTWERTDKAGILAEAAGLEKPLLADVTT